MGKRLVFILMFSAATVTALCQDAKKGNPILFADMLIGHAWGKSGGFSGGAALNFQRNRNLFTIRYVGTTKIHSEVLSPFFPIPLLDEKSNLNETSALYGWRFMKTSSAFCFSLGCSYNVFTEQVPDRNNQKLKIRSDYAGIPFEANFKWFKAKKERFRIYGIIPVGQPTSFGGSIGFKVFGNISQNSYGGLSLVYGLGFHKKYE